MPALIVADRFFPSVNWSESYPKRDEILGESA